MGVTDARKKGFTLVELAVAVFIMAILLTLTLPSYQQQLRNTRRSLGSAELLQVMMRQEQYFLDRKRYAGALTDLGFPASPYAIDAQGNSVSVQAGDRIYQIELTMQQDAYTLHATPQLSQAADHLCSTLSLDSTGIKRVTGTGTARDCW
jgi:type IV pilus assembly protein PilE